jgi:citronellol/citronellal dehydrogenase
VRLKDRVVLITGASRGIGAACALACAREGAHLALAAKSVEPHPTLPGTLGEVADGVRALGRDALVIPCDVRFEEQIQAMVQQTVAHFGRLDALINNAGAIFMANVADFPAKRFDLVMGVNVRAAFLASQAAMPHLRERGGHILMMSPPVTPKGAPHKGPYLVSKVGMTLVAQAIDAEEPHVAAHALWPVTGIKTAAVSAFGQIPDEQLRCVDILSDATVALLARDPKQCSFRAWLDEEVLADEGIVDLSGYRCDPDHEPAPHSILLVDPDWKRVGGD